MRYRRILLVTELGADASAALAAIRRVAPAAERLVVVARPPARPFAWLSATPPEPDAAADAWLDGLRQGASEVAARAEVALVPDLDPDALADVVAAASVDLAVAGPLPLAGLSALADLRKRRPVAVLWVPGPAAGGADRPLRELFCVALGARATASIAAFLRDHGDAGLRVTLLSVAGPSRDELPTALAVAGVRASVELLDSASLQPVRALDALAGERAIDLVVLARFPTPLLLSSRWPAPVLVPPLLASGAWAMERALDVPDLVDDGGPVRVRVAYAAGVGRRPPVPDQELAFVSAGRVAAVVTTRGGEAELPAGLGAEAFGVFRVKEQSATDPLAAVEQQVTVVRPGPRPLVLFDAALEEDELRALAAAESELLPELLPELLAVRLRPVRSCRAIRASLRDAGLAPRVIDASAVLDEGDATDVGEPFDAVRLARVASRLLAAGLPLAAIVHRGPHDPAAIGFAALRLHEVGGRSWGLPRPAARPATLAARLDAATAAAPLAGNRIEVELDNATARRWLLGAIAGASRRVHLQVYMASDDDVGRQVEAALAEAGRRGVAVRVLVDSLHAVHGSFGAHNPVLQRLSACPGVELRVWRPLSGVPSLEELKQRDHRKLVVADGRLALLGGRNLASEYYRGFEEVEVTPRTTWREVPWLDSGARVEGPAAAAVDRSFLEAWTEAGGAPFEILAPPPAGTTPARVVVHRGLRDAATLEAYLALVETARSHVYAVNGFPLLLELQHALLRALRRGVRVRALFGHVAPTHGGEPFEGPWAMARTAATELVHSRMDALVAAGGEGYQLAVQDLPRWAPGLGLVHPHVHAKVVSADGRAFAVGSANLDVTASYWESELLLVVEDAPVARVLEARLDALIAGSVRVEREDPAWQRLAGRREWLRHWPGVLSF